MAPSNLVSVIVPCFNAERYLPETLDSILAQTYRPVEIILIDDGSTDRTVEIAAARVPGLVVVRHDSNRGLNHARNTGLARARGTYIQFLDGDDLIMPDKLTRQAAVLDEDPSIDVVFSEVHEFEDQPHDARPEGWREHKDRRDYLAAFLVTNAMAIHSPLIRRSSIERLGGFATDFSGGGEDWDFWIRACLERWRFMFVPGVLCLYRKHAASMCGLGFRYYAWERSILPRAVERLRAHGVDDPGTWHTLALGLCRLAILAERHGSQVESTQLRAQADEIRPRIDSDCEQHSLLGFGTRLSTAYLGFSLEMLRLGCPEGAARFRSLAGEYVSRAGGNVPTAEQTIRVTLLRDQVQLCQERALADLETFIDVSAANHTTDVVAGDELVLEVARFLDRVGRLESRPDVLAAAAQASERAAMASVLHGRPNRLSSRGEWLLLRGRQGLLRAGLCALSRTLSRARRSERNP